MNSTSFKQAQPEFPGLDANIDAYVSSTVLFLSTDSSCTQNSHDVYENDLQDDSLSQADSLLTTDHFYSYSFDQTMSEVSYLPTDSAPYYS
jgi:hypothetical protein